VFGENDSPAASGSGSGTTQRTAGTRPVGVHAFLLHEGRRLPVAKEGMSLGRGDDCDVLLSGERVSRSHARVEIEAERFWLVDLGSRHGTELNGELLREVRRELRSGDLIAIGGETLRFISGGGETRLASRELPITRTQTVEFNGRQLSIGRDSANDLVLSDPNVSRFHAEIVARDGQVEIVDLDSRNGTRVNGALVDRASIASDSEVGIGPFGLLFDGATLVARDERGALRLEAEELAIVVGDKQILSPTSFSVEPGELVAVIGESGSGKSTLVKALAGVTRPSNGRISISGEPVSSRLTDIGYVPQDDIVHRDLTVMEALRYAARLRLPDDTSPQEIDATVNRVLDELALSEHASTRIGSLSGGQRKRTSVASELLSRPSLVFLDEPTTGLDPGLETKMMMLLRELADNARAVMVVTHATKNLRLCDKVAVMGRGGQLTYFGNPQGALEFFATEDFDGIYSALDERPATDWKRDFEQADDGAAAITAKPATTDGQPRSEAAGTTPTASQRRTQRRNVLVQTRVLTRRYVQLLLRDRKNLALLLGQAPILALANVVLFKPGLFDRPGGRPGDAVQLLFLLVIAVIWLGSIDAAREIVKEKSIFQREAAIGTRLSAYLASKAIVLFALVAVQTLVFAGVVVLFRPLDAATSVYAEVIGILVLTGFASVSMGLLISAAVTSEDQSISLTPLALIPQLLFAGAIIPVAQMTAPVKAVSTAMFAQWSLAGIGTALDMNQRIAEDPAFARADRFGSSFFDVGSGAAMLALAGFITLFLLGAAVMLARRARR
jgi:ABC-type multidrug transport system ATPase subunit